jgi:ribosome-associated protein
MRDDDDTEDVQAERSAFCLADGRGVPAAAVRFAAARASGPGGQNVNRRSTKVQVRVRVDALPLSASETETLKRRLRNHVTSGGDLIVTAETQRTQAANRRVALRRLASLIDAGIVQQRERVKTPVPHRARERRLALKRRRSQHLRGRGEGSWLAE